MCNVTLPVSHLNDVFYKRLPYKPSTVRFSESYRSRRIYLFGLPLSPLEGHIALCLLRYALRSVVRIFQDAVWKL